MTAGPSPLPETTARWFPLLPRPRPAARPLADRVHEVCDLADDARHGTSQARMSSAAEACNKAALVASDCGHAAMARALCWSQFGIFATAMPLGSAAARLALRPLINLGRLLTRAGDGHGSYQIYQSLHEAVTTRAQTTLDGRTIDLSHLVRRDEDHRELRRFVWTILLADGTRALTTAGHWDEAVAHLRRHKGIGARLLDGRQPACAARDILTCAHSRLAVPADSRNALIGILRAAGMDSQDIPAGVLGSLLSAASAAERRLAELIKTL